MSWITKYKQCIDQAKEIALEKSQQAAKKFSLAKQMVMETAGQVEATSEAPLITENFQKVEQTRLHVKTLYKLMKEVNNTGQAHLQAMKAFTDALVALGENFEMDSASYAEAMVRMAHHLIAVEKAGEEMIISWENGFIIPMETFVKMDVKNAIISKKDNYDDIRVAYDAEKARQKTRAEQVASTDFQALEESFMESEIDTIELLREVNDRREVDTLAATKEMLEAQNIYFKTCYEHAEAIKPYLSELQFKLDEKRNQQKVDKDLRDAERRQRLKDKEPISLTTKLFGVPLLRILKRENRQGNEVPILIQEFLDYIQQKGLEEEGIFRVSGTKSHVERLKNDCERGKPLNYDEIVDPHVISGLFKMFLRELPEPLLTFDLYRKFLSAKAESETDDIDELIDLTHQLPQANYVLLEKLMSLLHQVCLKSDVNKMGPQNLATVFGPNLLRPSDPTEGGFSDNAAAGKVVRFMVANYKEIFTIRKRPLTEENYAWFVEDLPTEDVPSATKSRPAILITRGPSTSGSSMPQLTPTQGQSPDDDDFLPSDGKSLAMRMHSFGSFGKEANYSPLHAPAHPRTNASGDHPNSAE